MNRTVVVVLGVSCLLFVLTSCGDDRSQRAALPDIELPAVRECGSIPSGKWVIHVWVTKEGDVHVEGLGCAMSLRSLRHYLLDKRIARGVPAGDRAGRTRSTSCCTSIGECHGPSLPAFSA